MGTWQVLVWGWGVAFPCRAGVGPFLCNFTTFSQSSPNRISSLWKLFEAINVARTSDTKAGDLAPVPDRLQAYVYP